MENRRPFRKEQSLAVQKEIYAAVPEERRNELAALYACLDYRNYSPVKRFEEASGLRGIYHNYKFPEDMNPLEYEALMKPMRIYEVIERGMNPGTDTLAADLQKTKPQSLFAVRRMYQELVDLNPELKEARVSPSRSEAMSRSFRVPAPAFRRKTLSNSAVPKARTTTA